MAPTDKSRIAPQLAEVTTAPSFDFLVETAKYL